MEKCWMDNELLYPWLHVPRLSVHMGRITAMVEMDSLIIVTVVEMAVAGIVSLVIMVEIGPHWGGFHHHHEDLHNIEFLK
jgi:hypothetical protein